LDVSADILADGEEMPENLPALSRSTLDTSKGFLCLQKRKTPAERGFETIWMTMELMINTVVYS
jgi:hypothetical protein